MLTYEKQALSGAIEILSRSELPDEFEGTKLYGSPEEDELRQDCKIFRLSNETGYGLITVYQVFPGIELYYNDMHIGYCNQNQATAKNMIEINHCLIGRFECSFGENSCCYMAEGDLSISSMMKKKSNSCFPLNHYHGISIIINLDELLPEVRQIMELLNIDLHYRRILLGGTDIAPLNSTMLMKNFSIVFQDVVLFNNTIMENIRVGKKDATDEEVVAAAKAAQCDEFISKLPDGYQTVIGENGSTLSGGECQRLSIARALLKDAPVILLDEATASLDVDNETEIQNAISRLVKGKTVLIIAHRMRTVESADNIVVLSDGIVAENGTHEELMKENGLYRRLVDLQTASANWKLSV